MPRKKLTMEERRERYEVRRRLAVETLRRLFGEGPIPLDVAASFLPVLPEWEVSDGS